MIVRFGEIKKRKMTFRQYLNDFLKENRTSLEDATLTLLDRIVKVTGTSQIKEVLETGVIPEHLITRVKEEVNNYLDKYIVYLTDKASQDILSRLGDITLDESIVEDITLKQITTIRDMFVGGYVESLTDIHMLMNDDPAYENLNINDVAKIVREGAGLAHNHLRATINTYRTLVIDGELKRSLAKERALKIVRQKTASRAKTIANDIILNNYRKNERATVNDLIDRGVLVNVTKKWSSSQDNRVCPICRALDKLPPVGIDEYFEYEGTLYDGESGAHPNCRCGVIYEENEERILHN